MKHELVRDTRTTTTTTYGEGRVVTSEKRIIEISLTEVTDLVDLAGNRGYRMRPDTMVIKVGEYCRDEMPRVELRGIRVLRDGRDSPTGTRESWDYFADGRSRWGGIRPNSPAWIAEIVKAYL